MEISKNILSDEIMKSDTKNIIVKEELMDWLFEENSEKKTEIISKCQEMIDEAQEIVVPKNEDFPTSDEVEPQKHPHLNDENSKSETSIDQSASNSPEHIEVEIEPEDFYGSANRGYASEVHETVEVKVEIHEENEALPGGTETEPPNYPSINKQTRKSLRNPAQFSRGPRLGHSPMDGNHWAKRKQISCDEDSATDELFNRLRAKERRAEELHSVQKRILKLTEAKMKLEIEVLKLQAKKSLDG